MLGKCLCFVNIIPFCFVKKKNIILSRTSLIKDEEIIYGRMAPHSDEQARGSGSTTIFENRKLYTIQHQMTKSDPRYHCNDQTSSINPNFFYILEMYHTPAKDHKYYKTDETIYQRIIT